ncbi:alpha-ketoacid dehydrogenase subunit beta [Tessaracoccus sp. MC1865]|nr:pyruvate dehydrogenase complex E1 component subunit beta [Tessaracoccus sp. MC1865]MBB1482915.1 alpha-ketoacid dehydrogenase subunit beta [Tessaracoccus sp. MC1865]
MRMNQAISAALADAMAADDSVVVLGEDVAAAGGPFKTSDGLLERYGPERVRDTPISEMAFTGAAVGAAMHGLRPVVEIMFMEFLGVALDQLATEAAKIRYLSRSQYTVPMVLRASVGSGTGFGCQHSQTLENWVSATPGLSVVSPSDAQTAYSLLRAAIEHPDPVVVLEPRVLYGVRSEVDTGHRIAIGHARVARGGVDATLIALGRTTRVALEAAERLAQEGIEAEVVDLLTLVPLDRESVLSSVRRTGRLVVVEDSPHSGGWGSEIVSLCAAEAFGDLKAPPCRVSAPDVPVPYGKELEEMYAPSADEVVRQVQAMVGDGQPLPDWWDREGLTVKGATA